MFFTRGGNGSSIIPGPLRGAHGRLGAGAEPMDLAPGRSLPIPVLRQFIRANSSPACGRPIRRDAWRSRPPRPTQGRRRLPSLPPISIAADAGGLRQAALAAPPTSCTISRAAPTVSPSPIHRLVTVTHDAVSFRWKDYRHGSQHADARRRRISPSLPPARPPEALRPHPLFRLPRVAVPHPRATPVSPGACRRPNATGRTARHRTTPNVVAMSPLRCPHAHRRTADCTTALPSRAPRERHTTTPRVAPSPRQLRSVAPGRAPAGGVFAVRIRRPCRSRSRCPRPCRGRDRPAPPSPHAPPSRTLTIERT